MDCGTFLDLLPLGPGAEAFRQAFLGCTRPHATAMTVAGLAVDIAGVTLLVREVIFGLKSDEITADEELLEEFRLPVGGDPPSKVDRRARSGRSRRRQYRILGWIGWRANLAMLGLRLLIIGFGLQIIGALLR